jgi:hypothetical protein
MKLSCAKKCRIVKFFANFKCPNCFSVEACGMEEGKCDCRLKGGPRLRFLAD